MTPTRARGLGLGIRQLQALRQMARSDGRWPVGWKLRGYDRDMMRRFVDRGWVTSLDDPVLTDEGRRIAYWV